MFGKGAPRCPRCSQAVYQAEEVVGAGQKWHNHCFTCKDCNTRLSSTTLTERNGEIYCSPCYGKNFGPKGFNIGGNTTTTGVSVSDTDQDRKTGGGGGGGSRCVNCGASGQQGKFCGECGKSVSSISGGGGGGGGGGGNSSNTYKPTVTSQAFGTPAKPTFGAGEKCAKCNQSVFAAEKVTAAGRSFHESCFVCEGCSTRLNSLELTDKDGKLYCGACYSRFHGPKGYGYGGGASGPMAFTR